MDARFRTESIEPGTWLIAVAGEIDLANVGVLDGYVEDAMRESARNVVIDLADVEHLDSTALARLLSARQSVLGAGMRFGLVAPHGPLRRAFEVRGLADLFTLWDSRGDAVAAFGERG